MIKYKLVCKDCNNIFDSWFSSSKEYEKLKKRKYLNCHICNSRKIEKTLMAPNVLNSSDFKNEDINKIKKLISIFEKKWKGKIKKLSAEEIVKCLKQYEKINEKAGIISTHSSLSFASNMQDSEISQYNAKIADFFSDTFSKLVLQSFTLSH